MTDLSHAKSPDPPPLPDDFFMRLELAMERPDPVRTWEGYLHGLRKGLAAAAVVAVLVVSGWIGSGIPAARTQDEVRLMQTVEERLRR